MNDDIFSNLINSNEFALDSFVVDSNDSQDVQTTKERVDPSTYRMSSEFADKLDFNNQFREQGWTSPLDPANKNETVLQFKFDQERTINRLSFELFNVPQFFSIYYYDSNRKEMVLLKDFQNSSVQGSISGLREPVQGLGVAWVRLAYVLTTVQTNLVEFRLKRDVTGIVTLGFNPMYRYHLGLKKVYFSFNVTPPPPPPPPPPGPPPPPPGGGDDDDIVLPPEEDFPQYSLLSFSAAEALNLRNSFWQSPPLGPTSVYPFIVDLRDAEGNAQTFDMIKMVSLYTGSFMNVYYSNDDNLNTFALSKNNRKDMILRNDNQLLNAPDSWEEGKGILLSDNEYWIVPNTDVRVNTAESFTVGMQLEANQFTNVDKHISTLKDQNNNLILTFENITATASGSYKDILKAECSNSAATFTFEDSSHGLMVDDFILVKDISLSYYNGVWKITAVDGATVTVTLNKKALPVIEDTTAIGSVHLAANTTGTLKLYQIADNATSLDNPLLIIEDTSFIESYKYAVGFGYNKTNKTWSLFKSRMNTDELELETFSSQYVGSFATEFIMGGKEPNELIEDFQSFRGYLSNVWIKQDSFSSNVIKAYLRNTNNFMNGIGERSSRINGFFNTLLSASLTSSYQYRYGPNRAYYEIKQWKPVNKDFVLNTNLFKMGFPIKAKFVKLEFSKPIGKYYNPATLENIMLPVYAYPTWIRKWFYENHSFSNEMTPYTNGNFLFERTNNLGNGKKNYGLINIKSAIDGSKSSTIFNFDEAGIDLILNDQRYDEFIISQQVKNSSIHMRFPFTDRHTYQVYYVPMRNKKAYFYGIQSLQFLLSKPTTEFNNKSYLSFAMDDSWIEDNNGFREAKDEEEFLFAEEDGATLLTKTFESFSDFKSFQFGALCSPMTDLLAYDKINLTDISHISRFNLNDTDESDVPLEITKNIKGSSEGQTILLKRLNEGQYGFKTENVVLPVTNSKNVTVVAGCRIRSLSNNPLSTYEMRLVTSTGKVAATKKIVPNKQSSWGEYELTYLAGTGETSFNVQIIQTDFESTEKIYVDMVGLWMSPFKFEIVTDFDSNPKTFLPIVYNVSNPFGIINLPAATNKLCLKITALKAGSWFSGWAAIPHYLNTPINLSTQIFKQHDWAVSDETTDRLANRQIFFTNNRNKMLPRRYSTYNDIIGSRTVY